MRNNHTPHTPEHSTHLPPNSSKNTERDFDAIGNLIEEIEAREQQNAQQTPPPDMDIFFQTVSPSQDKKVTPNPAVSSTKKLSKTIDIATSNDDLARGDDDGKTFDFSAQYKDPSWTVGGTMTAYTQNTGWNPRNRTVTWRRIDHAEMYILKTVDNTKTRVGNIITRAGVGVQWIGNFGGSTIQNTWHKRWPIALTQSRHDGMRYGHAQVYERDHWWKKLQWWTPDVRLQVEGKTRPIFGNERYGASIFGKIDAKVPFVPKYGETAVKATAGVEAHLNRVTASAEVTTHLYRQLPSSQVIRSATNNPDTFATVRLSADVWKRWNTTISPYASYSKWFWKNSKGSWQGTVWVRFEF